MTPREAWRGRLMAHLSRLHIATEDERQREIRRWTDENPRPEATPAEMAEARAFLEETNG